MKDSLGFVSQAKAMDPIRDLLNQLRKDSMRGDAAEPAGLILGEVGSGKATIGQLIHKGSRRAMGPWVVFGSQGLSVSEAQIELFGVECGASLGGMQAKKGLLETSAQGTLFIRGVQNLDLNIQKFLVQAIRTRKFKRVGGNQEIEMDVRILASSTMDLRDRVRSGQFDSELYQLLSGFVVNLPPLRERTEDVLPLSLHLASSKFKALGRDFQGFSPDSESWLVSQRWMGNIRELVCLLELVALRWDHQGLVRLEDLTPASGLSKSGFGSSSTSGPSFAPRLQILSSEGHDYHSDKFTSFTDLKKHWSDQFEKDYLVATLNKNGGNVSAAAREAKLDRSNFLRLLRRHGLKAQEYRKAA